jgi:hypothetical protein
VAPWSVPDGSFWNEPFGASTPLADVASVDDALVFLRRGHDLAVAAR